MDTEKAFHFFSPHKNALISVRHQNPQVSPKRIKKFPPGLVCFAPSSQTESPVPRARGSWEFKWMVFGKARNWIASPEDVRKPVFKKKKDRYSFHWLFEKGEIWGPRKNSNPWLPEHMEKKKRYGTGFLLNSLSHFLIFFGREDFLMTISHPPVAKGGMILFWKKPEYDFFLAALTQLHKKLSEPENNPSGFRCFFSMFPIF